MIPAGIKAGTAAFKILRGLYRGKKAVRSSTKSASKFFASKKMPGTAKFAESVGKQTTKATRYATKTVKDNPKTASFVGGAMIWDILDSD
tara:strand:+ start:233 stop:502 length:270 start_codon:yes stop_codon:yes gene_type:complete